MLIRAIVGNQIKMLNTAAKQSPGKDANTFMLITQEGGKRWREKERADRAAGGQASGSCEGERSTERM